MFFSEQGSKTPDRNQIRRFRAATPKFRHPRELSRSQRRVLAAPKQWRKQNRPPARHPSSREARQVTSQFGPRSWQSVPRSARNARRALLPAREPPSRNRPQKRGHLEAANNAALFPLRSPQRLEHLLQMPAENRILATMRSPE